MLELSDLPLIHTDVVPPTKFTTWNTKKKSGWDTYRYLTEDNKVLTRAADMDSNDPETLLKTIEKELTRVKHISFGKIKVSTKDPNQKELERLQRKKIEFEHKPSENDTLQVIDREMVEVMKKIQRNKYERDMKILENVKNNKGKSASNFQLKEMVLGKKKTQQEPIVIIDPETGKKVHTPKEIKEVSLNYCINLLKNKEPLAGYEEVVEEKDTLHSERMNENPPDDLHELPMEAFLKACESLKKKPGKYEFFKKAGKSLAPALFNLFQTVWRTESIPKCWNDSTIIQLEKPNSKVGDLDGIRHIHDKNEWYKFFGQIVTHCIKEPIFRNLPRHQIACRPGHRPSEHIFVLKSVISFYQSQ